MNKLSFYLGRKVICKLSNGLTVRGLLEQWKGNEYYLVLYDGSRCYFKSNYIEWIKYQ